MLLGFCLSLSSGNLITMCFSLDLFELFYLDFIELLKFVNSCLSSALGNFGYDFFKYYFSFLFSLGWTLLGHYLVCLVVLHRFLRHYYFFIMFYFFSDWLISIGSYSSSLILLVQFCCSTFIVNFFSNYCTFQIQNNYLIYFIIAIFSMIFSFFHT